MASIAKVRESENNREDEAADQQESLDEAEETQEDSDLSQLLHAAETDIQTEE